MVRFGWLRADATAIQKHTLYLIAGLAAETEGIFIIDIEGVYR
jgi:hypothetical protein